MGFPGRVQEGRLGRLRRVLAAEDLHARLLIAGQHQAALLVQTRGVAIQLADVAAPLALADSDMADMLHRLGRLAAVPDGSALGRRARGRQDQIPRLLGDLGMLLEWQRAVTQLQIGDADSQDG